jgi:two-component system LytT family response regulator
MIEAVIIDDELKAREIMKQFINSFDSELEIIGTADSVESGYKLLMNTNPQVVFLDVEMLDGTGFDLLQKLEDRPFKVIFTTAYDQYAIKAFKYNTIDYLLKPINITELEEAVRKVQEIITSDNTVDNRLEDLLSNFKQELKVKKLAVSSASGIDFLRIDEIMYCEADTSYTYIHSKSGKKTTSSKGLSQYEKLVPASSFIRVNRAFLINIDYIDNFRKTSNIITMKDGTEIELSRRKKKEFLELVHG